MVTNIGANKLLEKKGKKKEVKVFSGSMEVTSGPCWKQQVYVNKLLGKILVSTAKHHGQRLW